MERQREEGGEEGRREGVIKRERGKNGDREGEKKGEVVKGWQRLGGIRVHMIGLFMYYNRHFPSL